MKFPISYDRQFNAGRVGKPDVKLFCEKGTIHEYTF